MGIVIFYESCVIVLEDVDPPICRPYTGGIGDPLGENDLGDVCITASNVESCTSHWENIAIELNLD